MDNKRLASLPLMILSISAMSHSQPPIRLVQQPVDAITLPGETVLLQCVFFDDRRSLLVSSEWYRNGESTVGLQRHSEFHNPGTTITIGLLIENVMRADDGAVYHCSPVGRPDITSKLVSITVADVPEFPQNESIISAISATYSTITIQWEPATTLPIAEVNRYIIHVYDYNGLNGVYTINDGNTLNFTINELQSSTLYYINIVAINVIGQSSPTTNTSVSTKTFTLQSPPTSVDVCVSFDRENNPTLHIEWQAPSADLDQDNRYYILYGRNTNTTKHRVLTSLTNATIHISRDDISETFVVQISTANSNGKSVLTTPVIQYINPLYSVEQLHVTTSSTILQCQLACMTSGLQCGIVSLLVNFEEVPLIDVHQRGQCQLLLEGLNSSTIYDYCVSAFDTVTNNTIGFQLCGNFETGNSSSSGSSSTNINPGAMIGGFCGAIVVGVMIIFILAYWCWSLKNDRTTHDQPPVSDEVKMDTNPAYAVSTAEADPAYKDLTTRGYPVTINDIPPPLYETAQPNKVQMDTNPAYVASAAEKMEDDPAYKGRTGRKAEVGGEGDYS
ncbi:protein sidekick-like isoform X2 [Dysidea avara]|uniref:protein sidekick-like isoform X2 n=1 Tax=Dysidea avara TaxID=196820 RepID=UPI00332A03CD